MMKKHKVIVCQHGARHRYAVPRMLEEAGMLSALYTDSSAHSFVGRLSSFFGDVAFEKARRLANRKIQGVSTEKIFSSDIVLFDEIGRKILAQKDTGIKQHQRRYKVLSSRMKIWGTKDANVIYSMFYEHLDFVHWAKLKGLKSIIEVYVNPLTERIVNKEIEEYPREIRLSTDFEKEVSLREKLWSRAAQLADLLLCPSEYVAEGVRQLTPHEASKICIVPYGCSIDFRKRTNSPLRGRVLLVGNDAIRKGLFYFAEAIESLRQNLVDIDARVVGDIPMSLRKNDSFRGVNFLGKMTSEEVMAEYLAADLFVLPSLSEGFAGVVAEAICAGCPVVVTEECGSPVKNEREGLVIRSRDSASLAQAIKRILTDREFRDKCSINGLKQKSFYSENAWKNRLVSSFDKIAYD